MGPDPRLPNTLARRGSSLLGVLGRDPKRPSPGIAPEPRVMLPPKSTERAVDGADAVACGVNKNFVPLAFLEVDASSGSSFLEMVNPEAAGANGFLLSKPDSLAGAKVDMVGAFGVDVDTPDLGTPFVLGAW